MGEVGEMGEREGREGREGGMINECVCGADISGYSIYSI